jgi:hypothetical protein
MPGKSPAWIIRDQAGEICVREENRRFWPVSQEDLGHRKNFCDLFQVGTFFAIEGT